MGFNFTVNGSGNLYYQSSDLPDVIVTAYRDNGINNIPWQLTGSGMWQYMNGSYQYNSGSYSGGGGGYNSSQQSWPIIPPILSSSDFVGWGTPGIKQNCFDYARAQLGKLGYDLKSPSYWDPNKAGVINSGIYQTYSTGGANKSQLLSGINYITNALSSGIPVMVGVDNHTGSPNADKVTDHFVVIVGMGTDSKGQYFQFYDNASSMTSQGVNSENKLYYDSSKGILSGKSNTSYAQQGEYNYIVTQIRESKKR